MDELRYAVHRQLTNPYVTGNLRLDERTVGGLLGRDHFPIKHEANGPRTCKNMTLALKDAHFSLKGLQSHFWKSQQRKQRPQLCFLHLRRMARNEWVVWFPAHWGPEPEPLESLGRWALDQALTAHSCSHFSQLRQSNTIAITGSNGPHAAPLH